MQVLVIIDEPWNISSSPSTVPYLLLPLLLPPSVILLPNLIVDLAPIISELQWDFPFQPRECNFFNFLSFLKMIFLDEYFLIIRARGNFFLNVNPSRPFAQG